MRIAADDPRVLEAYEGERIEVNAVASNTESIFSLTLDGEPLPPGAFLWPSKERGTLVARFYFSEARNGAYELQFRASDGVQQAFQMSQAEGERSTELVLTFRTIGHTAGVSARLYRCSLGHVSIRPGKCAFDGRDLIPLGPR